MKHVSEILAFYMGRIHLLKVNLDPDPVNVPGPVNPALSQGARECLRQQNRELSNIVQKRDGRVGPILKSPPH